MQYSAPIKKLAERLQEALHGNSSSYAHQLYGQTVRMAKLAEGLEQMAAMRNPSETEAAHRMRVAKHAKNLLNEADSIDRSFHAITREGLAKLNEAMPRESGLVVDGHAQEIRATFRNMTYKERLEALDAAQKGGKGNIVAAVTTAPGILSGLQDEICERVSEAFLSDKCPDLIGQRNELLELFQSPVVAVGALRAAARQEIQRADIEKFERDSAQAANATASFTSALSGSG